MESRLRQGSEHRGGEHQRSEHRVAMWVREPIGSEHHLVRHWLQAAESRASCRLANILKHWNLIPSEWVALKLMYGPGRAAPGSIAQSLGMSKGGASKLVNRLVKKGLATKSVSDLDRRFRAVGLTESGEELVSILAPHDRKSDREFVPEAGPERLQLIIALRKLVTAPEYSALRPTGRPVRRTRAPEIGPVTCYDPLLGILNASAIRG